MNDKKGAVSLQKKDVIKILIGIIIVLVIILLYLLLFNNSTKNYEPNITINGEETVPLSVRTGALFTFISQCLHRLKHHQEVLQLPE